MKELGKNNDEEDTIAYNMSQEEADDITKFQLFGFLPELIARFNRIVTFSPLIKETLKEIIHLNIMNYKTEFEEEST